MPKRQVPERLASLPIDTPIAATGFWRLPGHDASVAGTLTCKDGNIELALLSPLPGAEPERMVSGTASSEWDVPVIVGETPEQDLITLLDCSYTRWPMFPKTDGPTDCRLFVNRLLIGTQLDEPSEQTFADGYVSFPSLPEWASLGRLDWDFPDAENGSAVTVHWRHPVGFSVTTSEGVSVELNCFLSLGRSGDQHVLRRASFRVHAPSPRDAAFFQRAFHRIELLFSLLIGHPNRPDRLGLELSEGDGHPWEIVSLRLPYRTLEVEPVDAIDMLTRFDDVERSLPAMIEAVLSLGDEMGACLAMFVAAVREPARFIDVQFLLLMQSLEMFVRERHAGRYAEKADYRRVRKEVLAGLPADVSPALRESVMAALGHANEHGLRQMILAAIGTLSDAAVRLFCDDPNAFVGVIVTTRNFYTHRGPEGSRFVLKGLDLHRTNRKLSCFLSVLLLRDLGLAEDSIVAAFGKFGFHPFLRHHWKGTPESAAKE